MWGDLRGGKKSIGELKAVPMEITVTLSNPGLALKRQQSWEQVKESAAKNVSLYVARWIPFRNLRKEDKCCVSDSLTTLLFAFACVRNDELP